MYFSPFLALHYISALRKNTVIKRRDRKKEEKTAKRE
jgi:hypothetical protein